MISGEDAIQLSTLSARQKSQYKRNTDIIPEMVKLFTGSVITEMGNKVDKVTVGTFYSIQNLKNAVSSFGTYISQIDWSKSETLNSLFLAFMSLGRKKP